MGNHNTKPRITYLRFDDLKEKGMVTNRITLSRWIESGRFPAPVHLGPNTIAWRSDEIEAWEEARAEEREAAQ